MRDYALLKLQKVPPGSLKPLTVDRVNVVWQNSRFDSMGFYRGDEGIGLAPLRGSVDGPLFPDVDQSNSWCYRLQTSFDVEPGYSGAPIVVNGQVIGIQSGRLDPRRVPRVGFAVPLQTIKSKTRTACKALLDQRDDWASRMKSLADALPKGQPWSVTHERWVIVVGPQSLSASGSEILDGLRNSWDSWQEVCSKPLANWAWLAPRPLIKLEPHIRARDESQPDAGAWHHYVGNDAIEPIPRPHQPYVRVLLDSGAEMQSTTANAIAGLELVSHSLTIHLRIGPTALVRESELISIVEPSVAEVVDSSFKWLESVLLDINVFHRSRMLPALFPDMVARRRFTELKNAFLVEHGLAVPFENAATATYTIAEHCRVAPHGNIDFAKYEKLWRTFIDEQLFVSMATKSREKRQQKDAAAEIIVNDITTGQIRTELVGHPLLVGQLSTPKIETSLRKYLASSSHSATGLHAFVVTIRRPHRRTDRTNLATLLGYPKWRRNLSAIVPFSDLSKLMEYARNIKLVLFRM